MTEAASWLDAVSFNADGLVPVIAQDAADGCVLMMAWMNREALSETFRRGQLVYYSRSRQRLWAKGESSGHVQHLVSLQLDCDGDTLLAKVTQVGGIACHTGRRDCFYQQLDEQGRWQELHGVLKAPEDIYR